MELLALGLAIFNAGLVVTVLLVIVRRPSGGTTLSAEELRSELRAANGDIRMEFSSQRAELTDALARHQRALEARLDTMASMHADEFARDRAARTEVQAEVREAQRSFQVGVEVQLEKIRTTVDDKLQVTLVESLSKNAARIQELGDVHTKKQAELQALLREELEKLWRGNEAKLEKMRETVDEKLQGTLVESLAKNDERIQALTESSAKKHAEMQMLLREELEKLRSGNEAKLEKMRETVDEKLQGTLEKRLGESFSLVSERLEQVQKGLGEMQSLASDVGGLKRVLTNVKSRGTWGEVQLSRQLEDILSPDQYEANVAIKPGSRESVEFAVRLPGRSDDGTPVYLPIDSKFPQEDYERLLDAQERGEKVEIDAASAAIERAIVAQAKTISSKYIEPPLSTDFAIMYLPTEGLFAEVARRPGLASRLQSDHRVVVTGPTTLMSLLNSLQMGFRSVAIEKRSSEVWQVLSAAKAEFAKYGQVWEKLGKQLQTAQNTVTEAGRRTRAVERKLRSVETIADTGAIEDGPSAADALVLDDGAIYDELVGSPAVETVES